MSSSNRLLKAAAILLMVGGGAVYAAAPPAGTVIGNQAVATYQDANSQTVTVTSNAVQTVVQEVAGVAMTNDNAKAAAPGGKVFLPHVVTNLGNATDTFGLAPTETGDFTFDAIVLYPDADLDGVPDTLTPITATPALGPGETFGFVIEAGVPSGATPAESADITVTATSDNDGTQTAANTDTVTVSTGPVIELTKQMALATDSNGNGVADPGDTVTITMTYANTGIADASTVTIDDDLPGGGAFVGGLSYVDDSVVWSDFGPMGASNSERNGSGHDLTVTEDTALGATVSFELSAIPSGKSGTIAFEAEIDSATEPGQLDNVATATVGGETVDSNVASITVEQTFDTDIADVDAGGFTDDGAAGDDTFLETDDVAEGASVPFAFQVTNSGNARDRFNVSVANGDFPAGTTFDIAREDGVTPLLDSNGDGIPDVGPLEPGGTQNIVVIANLPTGTTGAVDVSATVTSASVGNSAQTDTATLQLQATITGAAVDLTNVDSITGGNPDGVGAGPEPSPVRTLTLAPGETGEFFFEVANNGPTADTFLLEYSSSNFIAGDLPTGWSITFFDSNGVQTANTGVIAAGSSAFFEARVTVADSATPVADQSIYFRTVSATNSNIADIKHDAVTVSEIIDVAITPNEDVQAAPSGVVLIPHTITNLGNVDATTGPITVTQDAGATHSVTLYSDINGNGAIDGADAQIDNIDDIGPIAPDDSVDILVRVQVPSTAVAGTSETLDVEVDVTSDSVAGNNTVTDVVTIVTGDVELVKEQALDANCDNTVGSYQRSQLAAEPGQCIRYRVTVTNTGNALAQSVVVTDATPTFTTHEVDCGGSDVCPVTISGAGTVSGEPGQGATGSVAVDVGDMTPSDVSVIEFTVRIDN